ncbi:RpiB/LacA/LacB family sugar-phosphate isomerase [Candidatus Woesearchaeota archaeon]|nr:RpiB/LacA/LacB family sugar-phosphate isomerase [Candidatus Woesearchaeota archaeon]
MIYIGADHAGFALKEKLKAYLQSKGLHVKDFGAWKLNPTDDYPDYAIPVAELVAKTGEKGILVCGSAEGVCIAANKVKGVRAIAAKDAITAKMSREHNDANVLCLAGGQTKKKMNDLGIPFPKAKQIVDVWLKTAFSNEERHRRRLKKIEAFERAT